VAVLDAIRTLLEQSPILALFAAMATGYAIGRISIAGFSLDIGGVLFTGLALGAIAPAAAPPALVGSIGLLMFLYGIGIQYGRQFFAGLRGDGLKWNALGALGVLASLAVALGAMQTLGLEPAHALGAFAGALTSTPALQAAIDAVGDRSPAVGYSVAYPGGVIVPILCIFLFSRLVTARLAPAPAPPAAVEVALARERAGTTLAEIVADLPRGVHVAALRHGGENCLPDPAIRLDAGDVLLLFGEAEAIERARTRLGPAAPGRLTGDRSNLDLGRFFVSRAVLTGVPLARVTFPPGVTGHIVEVRRGDAVLLPERSLVLEFGDRVAVIAPRADFPALRKLFGDSIKSTTEVSYISVGLGMSLGVLLGLIPFPIPGVGTVTMGLAGGPLVVALILGRLGRTGPLAWYLPLPANLTLRTFGLTLFLAAVGLGSGAPFVETLAGSGPLLLAVGLGVVVAAMLVGFLVGHFVLRMATDDLLGAVSGIAGNPAILVYANRTVESERIDAAYATIFPSLTILKIVCAQVALALLL
jgi:putative transport protein